MSFKKYGSVVVGLAAISFALADGSNSDITQDAGQAVANAPVTLADLITDAGLVGGFHAGGVDVAFNKDRIANAKAGSGGGTQIRFIGGAVLNVIESFADVKAALGL